MDFVLTLHWVHTCLVRVSDASKSVSSDDGYVAQKAFWVMVLKERGQEIDLLPSRGMFEIDCRVGKGFGRGLVSLPQTEMQAICLKWQVVFLTPPR